jgi:hypothetical protein
MATVHPLVDPRFIFFLAIGAIPPLSWRRSVVVRLDFPTEKIAPKISGNSAAKKSQEHLCAPEIERPTFDAPASGSRVAGVAYLNRPLPNADALPTPS